MRIHTTLIPSELIATEAQQLGVNPSTLMRDFYALTPEESNTQTITVGDMANNLVGITSHQLPELAAENGLPRDYRFNTGLLGSRQLQKHLGGIATTGAELIRGANEALRTLYIDLGMIAVADEVTTRNRAELATGYLTHAHITPDTTTLTSIGDVYAWVNGELVAGSEKEIDTLKDALIRNLWQGYQEVTDTPSVIGKELTEFSRATQLDSDITVEIARKLTAPDVASRQAIYRIIDDHVTPWQITRLQNNERHPLGYGAIDGTDTPDSFVTTLTLPTRDIDRLVIATDGSMPLHKRVRSVEDLAPVNPQYSEQAIVVMQR